ncbi:MAG TPA: hypothetical protein VGF29_04985 [Hyphomicrobiaceae bacterium]|jgi:hypothetical protein
MKTSGSPAATTGAQAQSIDHSAIGDDRLVGAEAIGHFIDARMSPRVARRLLEAGLYPCWREGKLYVASKAALVAHWRRMTSGEAA